MPRLVTLGLTLALASSAAAAASCATPTLVGVVEHYAVGFGLDADLLLALVWVESRFCPDAVSPKGAIGLGQLMPATAAGLGVDPTDLEQNVWGAAHYLRDRYEEFGDWSLALAAYNAGPGAVRHYGSVPPYEETQQYVKEVLGVYAYLAARR